MSARSRDGRLFVGFLNGPERKWPLALRTDKDGIETRATRQSVSRVTMGHPGPTTCVMRALTWPNITSQVGCRCLSNLHMVAAMYLLCRLERNPAYVGAERRHRGYPVIDRRAGPRQPPRVDNLVVICVASALPTILTVLHHGLPYERAESLLKRPPCAGRPQPLQPRRTY